MRVEVNITKKRFFFLILSVFFLAGAIFVYALSAGETPDPGHSISEVGAPAGCSQGQALIWSGSAWECGSAGGASGGGDYNLIDLPQKKVSCNPNGDKVLDDDWNTGTNVDIKFECVGGNIRSVTKSADSFPNNNDDYRVKCGSVIDNNIRKDSGQRFNFKCDSSGYLVCVSNTENYCNNNVIPSNFPSDEIFCNTPQTNLPGELNPTKGTLSFSFGYITFKCEDNRLVLIKQSGYNDYVVENRVSLEPI